MHYHYPQSAADDRQHCTATQLTPRTLLGSVDMEVNKGRILPLDINIRSGWRADLDGQTSTRLLEELAQEKVIRKSTIRTRDKGYSARVSDYPSGKEVVTFDYEEYKRSLTDKHMAEWIDDVDDVDEGLKMQ